MSISRAWTTYDPAYRAQEIEILADWIMAGESGTVVGLTGSGKSNLLGFLCQRPEVLQPYLPDNGLKLALVRVDLNNLPDSDLATFYRVILRALYESRARFAALEPSLASFLETLYFKVEDKPDAFLSQSTLREVLLLFQEEGVRLVLVLDPFDHFCQTAEPHLLDNLRGLRDSFKTTLSYLVGVRHELAYLRDPLEIDEIYELLDTHICWIGAMDDQDARWVINQVATTTGRQFTGGEIERLIALSGSYAALLKATSLWLVRLSPTPEPTRWPEAMLTDRSIQHRLKEIWVSLTEAEQLALSKLQKWQSRLPEEQDPEKTFRGLADRHGETYIHLTIKGLCRREDPGWCIRSELLAAYIASVADWGKVRVWLDEDTDTLYQGERPLENLTPLERSALCFLVKHPLKRHTKTDLIVNAWPDELRQYGVTDQSLYQVILDLRKKIEPNWTKPCYLITWRGKPEGGYQFFPEGRPS